MPSHRATELAWFVRSESLPFGAWRSCSKWFIARVNIFNFKHRLGPCWGTFGYALIIRDVEEEVTLFTSDYVRCDIAARAEMIVFAHQTLAFGNLILTLHAITLIVIIIVANSFWFTRLEIFTLFSLCKHFKRIEHSIATEFRRATSFGTQWLVMLFAH